MSVKTRKFHMWCDEEDYALLEYNARKAGMSKSEYIRNLLYHGSIEYRANYSPEDARKLIAEFCNISNSMAQIAYSAKLRLGVDEGEYLQLESNFKALFDVIGEHIIG